MAGAPRDREASRCARNRKALVSSGMRREEAPRLLAKEVKGNQLAKGYPGRRFRRASSYLPVPNPSESPTKVKVGKKAGALHWFLFYGNFSSEYSEQVGAPKSKVLWLTGKED